MEVSRFLVRTLAELPGLDRMACLRSLPAGSQPVCLDSSDGRGWSLLAWDPDRRQRGRLQSACAVSARPWPLAEPEAWSRLTTLLGREQWEREDPQPPQIGGWLGFLGFECGHLWEAFPWCPADPAGMPDFDFARYRKAICWAPTGEARLLWAEPRDGGRNPAELRVEREALRGQWRGFARLRSRSQEGKQNFDRERASPRAARLRAPRPCLKAEDFMQRVRRLRRWIGTGELFQANLSHRMVATAPPDPRAFYAALRLAQPTSMSAYYEDELGRVILSSSPERFLKVEGTRLETRPIKGTISRSGRDDVDRDAARRLQSSEKELAELTMIVDMARNDLGRIARVGSVRVETPGEVEAFTTLFHRTAMVRAEWDPTLGLDGLMRACFPPASITGAPKVRALQAIAELEQLARGPYCGALGAWEPGANPRGDFSVLIRSAVIAGGELSLRVGAGIVWDSDPRREWEETLLKGRYFRDAIRHEVAGDLHTAQYEAGA